MFITFKFLTKFILVDTIRHLFDRVTPGKNGETSKMAASMQESTDNDNDVSDKKTTQGELSDSDSDNEEIVCSFEKLSVFI